MYIHIYIYIYTYVYTYDRTAAPTATRGRRRVSNTIYLSNAGVLQKRRFVLARYVILDTTNNAQNNRHRIRQVALDK